MADLLDTDLLRVERALAEYQATFADLKNSVDAYTKAEADGKFLSSNINDYPPMA